MSGTVAYTEKGGGLHDEVRRQGYRLWFDAQGVAYADDAVAVQAIIDAYDPVAAAPVPLEVTNFQARAVLMQLPPVGDGPTLFHDIDAALRANKDADAAGALAWQAWEQANTFTRAGVLVNTMATQFGLSPAQLDGLFRAAALVEA